MTTELRTFNPRGHTSIDMYIRVVDFGGEPWFVAMDVCRAIGVSVYGKKVNTTDALKKLDASQKKTEGVDQIQPNVFDRRVKTVALISESGFYKLVMRSDKPQAKPFQDWVTKVVLPTVRKTGSYSVDSDSSPAVPPVDERIERLEALVERLADGMVTMATAMRPPEKQQEIAAQAKRLIERADLTTERTVVTTYRSFRHFSYGVNNYPLSVLHEADRLLAQ